jgi:hypothetical protein
MNVKHSKTRLSICKKLEEIKIETTLAGSSDSTLLGFLMYSMSQSNTATSQCTEISTSLPVPTPER